MLVVVEGLDGAGKSTQVALLRSYLEEKFGEVDYIHFPRYDAPVYGDLISRFLRGDFGKVDEVHPMLVALLYAEDRKDAAPAMKESLSKGRTLLLDRYVYSNIAYQCAKTSSPKEAEELRDWIFSLEFSTFGIPRPDVNIFLDVPLSFIESKLSSEREGNDRDYLSGGKDIHEADMSFQAKVRREYVALCGKDPSIRRIDCSDDKGNMLPAEEIFKRVRLVVDSSLKG